MFLIAVILCACILFVTCSEEQVGCFNHGVVILVAANLKRQRLGEVLETISAQGNQRDSYPDHLTTLNYPAC